MNISIIGTGYVGLVTGACLASMGMNVMCCDSDEKKIENLKNGVIPIYEPALESLVDNCVNNKKSLSFTTDIKEAVDFADVIFIAVNTPTLPDNTCDLTNVFDVATQIAQCMDRYKVIVNKSTVPVGTCSKMKDEMEKVLAQQNKQIDFDIVSNPEFLREGSAVQDFINPERIVLGTRSQRALAVVKEVYRELIQFNIPVLVTNPETAEMIKHASNAFLAMKVSFINEIANICEYCGADVSVVARGMGLDTRIGRKFLNPGPGFGGSCFPKDVRALIGIAGNFGYNPLLLSAVIEVNNCQKMRMVEKIENALGNLENCKIAVLGLSFKAGTDDIRESPAIDIISSLLDKKAEVKVYDPQAMENMAARYPGLNVKYCKDAYSACSRCDCIVLATEWKEFADLDLRKLKSAVRRPFFFDLRNFFEPDYVKSFGFIYEGVGRK